MSDRDLELAIMRGKTAKVDQLLRDGVDVNTAQTWRGTLLQLAVQSGTPEIVRLLLARGADVNRAVDEKPPLILAVVRGNLDLVDALLNAGANINVRTATGDTPLHGAARITGWSAENIVPIARRLLEAGANVNVPNQAGRTPLHEAARMYAWAIFRNTEWQDAAKQLLELLWDNGASLTARDDAGETAEEFGPGRLFDMDEQPKYVQTFEALKAKDRVRTAAKGLSRLSASGGIPVEEGGRGFALPPEMNAQILSFLKPTRSGPVSPAEIERRRELHRAMTQSQLARSLEKMNLEEEPGANAAASASRRPDEDGDDGMRRGGRRKKTARKTRRRTTRRRR